MCKKQLGGAVASMWGSYDYVAPQGRRIETVLSYDFCRFVLFFGIIALLMSSVRDRGAPFVKVIYYACIQGYL